LLIAEFPELEREIVRAFEKIAREKETTETPRHGAEER